MAISAQKHQRQPEEFPYWLVALAGMCLYLVYLIVTSGIYGPIFSTVMSGAAMTVYVTLVSFCLSIALGLFLALARVSRFILIRQMAQFYVELVRGLPMIVLLFYVAFVAAPALVSGYQFIAKILIENGFLPNITVRDFDLIWRAIFALVISYSAFISEIFRSGINAIGSGQVEAATALGLSRWQGFRLVILPQALRIVIPPLCNDFISLIKDSALVSALGVVDITYMGKVSAANNFRYFETYNIVAFIYLVMTLGLSFLIGRLEIYLKK